MAAHAAVVLGGVTYISSSGVIAKVLTDLGRLGDPRGADPAHASS